MQILVALYFPTYLHVRFALNRNQIICLDGQFYMIMTEYKGADQVAQIGSLVSAFVLTIHNISVLIM